MVSKKVRIKKYIQFIWKIFRIFAVFGTIFVSGDTYEVRTMVP